MSHEDIMLLASVISQICDYAVEHDMDPDDTLRAVAINILQYTEIATCKGWEGDNHE